MRWVARVVVLSAAAALCGCASDIGPSPAELKQTWESQNVYPAGYKADLMAYLRTYLNDPTQIRAASISQPQLKMIEPGERYTVCVRYNARNTDGRYAGPKEGLAIFVSGKLDRFFDVTKGRADRSLDTPAIVREFCKDAAYAAFPELEKLTR